MQHEYKLVVKFKSAVPGLEEEKLSIPWRKGSEDTVALALGSIQLVTRRAGKMEGEDNPFSNKNISKQLVKALEYLCLRYGEIPAVRCVDYYVNGEPRHLDIPQAQSWARSGMTPLYDGAFLKQVLLPIIPDSPENQLHIAVRNALEYVCASMRPHASLEERFRTTFSAWNVLYRANASRHEELQKKENRNNEAKHQAALIRDVGVSEADIEALNRLTGEGSSTSDYVKSIAWGKSLTGTRSARFWLADETMPPDRAVAEAVLEAIPSSKRAASSRSAVKDEADPKVAEIEALREKLEGMLSQGLPIDVAREVQCILRYHIPQLRNATAHGMKRARPFEMCCKDPDQYEDMTYLLRHAIKDAALYLIGCVQNPANEE